MGPKVLWLDLLEGYFGYCRLVRQTVIGVVYRLIEIAAINAAMARSRRPTSPSRLPVNPLRRQTRWIPKMNRITPKTAKTIIETFTQIILSIDNIHPSRQQNHWGLPLSTQLNDCLISTCAILL